MAVKLFSLSVSLTLCLCVFLSSPVFADTPPSYTVSGNLYYYHQDNLGSNSVMTDEVGNIVSTAKFQSYGDERSRTGTKLGERTYTDQIKDDTSNLMYYNARYYNPTLGIFTQPDQIGGIAKYAYASGNPINNSDPTGNTASDEGGGGGDNGGGTPDNCTEISGATCGSQPPDPSDEDKAVVGLIQKYSANPYLQQDKKDELNIYFAENKKSANVLLALADANGGVNTYLSMYYASYGSTSGSDSVLANATAGQAAMDVPGMAMGVGSFLAGSFNSRPKITLYKGISQYNGGDILPGGLSRTPNPYSNGGTYPVGTLSLNDETARNRLRGEFTQDYMVSRHAALGLTGESPLSSWTIYPEVAEDYAKGGTVVSINVHKDVAFDLAEIFSQISPRDVANMHLRGDFTAEDLQLINRNMSNAVDNGEYLMLGIIPRSQINIVHGPR